MNEKEKGKETLLRFFNIESNVRTLICDKKNEGSVFQVASQFNCLEMVNPGVSPANGVTIYFSDRTQGPACALWFYFFYLFIYLFIFINVRICEIDTWHTHTHIKKSCPAATAYRNYFCGENNEGQIEHQIDNLKDVGELLNNDKNKFCNIVFLCVFHTPAQYKSKNVKMK